ncbi:hypothetical protein B7494_g3337 [Chlorociboria aeruginascens]|nr:hypothetical protein B7494_g3337 [Chlorociboria aeruginascens]
MFKDDNPSTVRYHDIARKSDYLGDESLQHNNEQFICRVCCSNRSSRGKSKSCGKCICGRSYAESEIEPLNVLVGPSKQQGDSIEARGECLISRSISTTDSLNREEQNLKRRASKARNCSTLSLNQKDGNIQLEGRDRRFIRVQSMDSLVKVTVEDSPIHSPTTDQSQDTPSPYHNHHGRTVRANSRSFDDISVYLSYLDSPKLAPMATENIMENHTASEADSQNTVFKSKSARISPPSPTPSQSSSEVPADLLIEHLDDSMIQNAVVHEYMSDSMFARLHLKPLDPLAPTKLPCTSFKQDTFSSGSPPDSILDSTFAKFGSPVSNLSLSSSMLDSSWSRTSQEFAREASPTQTAYPSIETTASLSEFGFRPTLESEKFCLYTSRCRKTSEEVLATA